MRTVTLITLVLVGCLAMQAQTIDVNSTTGVFYGHTGGEYVGYSLGGSKISWGEPAGSSQSYYQFTGAQPPETVAVAPSTNFLLGTFTHGNFPIYSGGGITGVKLDVTLAMAIPSNGAGGGTNTTKTFTYNFSHWETPNSANPCANGGTNGVGVNVNGCADRALILNPTPNQTFTIDDVEYTLLMRFSQDGGQTFASQFWTIEGLANSAQLYGYFTTEVVPEPGFYGMLGLGLAGLYAAVRRRRAQA